MPVSRTQVVLVILLIISVPVVADVARNGTRLQLAGVIAAYIIVFIVAVFLWRMMRRR